MQNPSYRPEIDGLRGIAVLAVVFFHAFPRIMPGGFIGVDVFFVISGYLISRLLLRALNDQTFSLVDFWARRVKRLFPALIVVLVCAIAFGWLRLLSHEFEMLGSSAFYGSAFMSNFFEAKIAGYFAPTAVHKPLIHLWSLSIEEQFYLAWPVVLLFLWRLKERRLAWAILGLAFASFAQNLAWTSTDPEVAFFMPTVRAWELLCGASLAQFEVDRPALLPTWMKAHSSYLAASALLVIVVIALTIARRTSFPGGFAALPVAATVVLIATSGETSRVRALLTSRVAVLFGKISYPLYLWHWPLFSFAGVLRQNELSTGEAVMLTGVATLLAYLTYRFVETPLRRSISRRVPVLLAAALFAVAGFSRGVSKRAFPPLSNQLGMAKFAAAARDFASPQHSAFSYFSLLGQPIYIEGLEGESVVFVGDSNVGQYAPRAKWILKQSSAKHRVAFAILGNCLPIPGAIDEEKNPKCAAFANAVADYVAKERVTAVVVSARWGDYFNPEQLKAMPTAIAKLEEWLATQVSLGRRVYVVLSIPGVEEASALRSLKRSLLGLDFSIDSKAIDRRLLKYRDAVASIVRDAAVQSGAIVIDPLETLCNETHCPVTTEDGTPIYTDCCHLTATYVRERVTFLDQAFRSEGAGGHKN